MNRFLFLLPLFFALLISNTVDAKKKNIQMETTMKVSGKKESPMVWVK